MARIRLLVPVAGDLAPGLPAPGVGVPFEVDESIAETWCDGDRAERLPDVDTTPGEAAVHQAAQEYLDAVLEQHAAELAAVHDDAREYLAAVEAERAARIADLETQLAASAAKKATGKKPASE